MYTYGDTHDAPRYYIGEGHIASGGRSRCVRLWFMKSVCSSAVNRFAHRDIVCCHVCVFSCADLVWCSMNVCIHRAFGTMMLMMCSIYGNAVAAVRCVSSCKSIARCVICEPLRTGAEDTIYTRTICDRIGESLQFPFTRRRRVALHRSSPSRMRNIYALCIHLMHLLTIYMLRRECNRARAHSQADRGACGHFCIMMRKTEKNGIYLVWCVSYYIVWSLYMCNVPT